MNRIHLKKHVTLFVFLIFFFIGCSSDDESKTDDVFESITIKKIYGDGSTFCAFTSITKSNNIYYIAFREGDSHVSEGDFGVIRILQSVDGEEWTLMQTISSEGKDLRDPCICNLPDGNLMLICGARYKKDGTYTTTTMFSRCDNNQFCEPIDIQLPNEIANSNYYYSWLWRITWHRGVGYGVVYSGTGEKDVADIVKTTDGINYTYVSHINLPENVNECRIRFKSDDNAIALLRSETGDCRGYIGNSKPPYDNWEWKKLDILLAGQEFVIDNSLLVCATRVVLRTGNRTNIYFGDMDGNFRWSYTLPSSLDTSYAGVWDNGNDYLISYYAQHETDKKPSIYLCCFPKSIIPKL